MVLIGVARELGYTRVELLKYADSGDVTGDKSEVVAYAALSFEKP
jgi:AmmeMemoRadiSam system protein B